MKVTTTPPEPVNPDLVIRLSWEESALLVDWLASRLTFARNRDPGEEAAVAMIGLMRAARAI